MGEDLEYCLDWRNISFMLRWRRTLLVVGGTVRRVTVRNCGSEEQWKCGTVEQWRGSRSLEYRRASKIQRRWSHNQIFLEQNVRISGTKCPYFNFCPTRYKEFNIFWGGCFKMLGRFNHQEVDGWGSPQRVKSVNTDELSVTQLEKLQFFFRYFDLYEEHD